MNTKIEYLYRDAGNYKKYNTVIVSGGITSLQVDIIMSCLEVWGLFIPELVGLPARRLEEFSFQYEEDTPFFELEREGFQLTEESPTCDMSVEILVAKFEAARGNWYLEDFCW